MYIHVIHENSFGPFMWVHESYLHFWFWFFKYGNCSISEKSKNIEEQDITVVKYAH